MCFCVNFGEELNVAKEDLICYKILESGLISVYQDFDYKLNKTYKLFRWLKSSEEKYYLKHDTIYRGFHSYQRIEDVIPIERKQIIVKCIIPKRSKYYKSMILGHNQYVSNRIKIIEVL